MLYPKNKFYTEVFISIVERILFILSLTLIGQFIFSQIPLSQNSCHLKF